jgi:hypothetical protein
MRHEHAGAEESSLAWLRLFIRLFKFRALRAAVSAPGLFGYSPAPRSV